MKPEQLDSKTYSSESTGLFHGMFIGIALVGIALFGLYLYVEYNNAFEPFEKVPELSAHIEKNSDRLDELSKTDVAGLLGARGDYFGGLLNPILAFASFLALLYTIVLQTRELSMTREELTKTAEANEKQATALVEQVNATRQQQFDNTFATLLSEHNKILSEVDDNAKAQEVLQFKNCSRVKEARSKVLANDVLCKYYRVLYQLLKFIARNHPSNEKRQFSQEYLVLEPSAEEKVYSSLVRAMIPSNLILGLAHNCALGRTTTKDYLEYTLLVERYAMLEHQKITGLFSDSYLNTRSCQFDIISLYNQRAFGTNTSLSDFKSHYFKLLESNSLNFTSCCLTHIEESEAGSVISDLCSIAELKEYQRRKEAEKAGAQVEKVGA
ncbi:TPA: hypothetical protein NJ716_002303 [Vibrio parahaemolyticus]|nr:hypothetical protein [Vibrio parahaemolyticus]